MGRKTFESFPKGPLPGRRNIVISRRSDYAPAGVEVACSVDEALAAVEDTERAYVIGGAEIYRQFMPMASQLDITEIDAAPDDADAFFPPFDAIPAEIGPWQGENPRWRIVNYKL